MEEKKNKHGGEKRKREKEKNPEYIKEEIKFQKLTGSHILQAQEK